MEIPLVNNWSTILSPPNFLAVLIICIVLVALVTIQIYKYIKSVEYDLDKFNASFSLLAVVLLTIAVANPLLVNKNPKEDINLIFILDISESVTKTDGGLSGAARVAAESLESVISNKDKKDIKKISLVIFSNDVKVVEKSNFDQALSYIKSIERQPEALPSPKESNLEHALRVTYELASKQSNNQIILVTDGLETQGTALDILSLFRNKGLQVNVFPRNSTWKESGIEATFLPTSLKVNQKSWLRLLIANPTAKQQSATLTININGSFYASKVLELDAAKNSLRIPIMFNNIGIHYVDAVLNIGSEIQKSRRFTTVTRKAKIVSVSDSHDWTQAIDLSKFQIEKLNPRQFKDYTDDYDAIVIDSIYANLFNEDSIENIKNNVLKKNKGLFIINGDHRRALHEPTVTTSYTQSKLEELLPVSSSPREIEVNPPERKITLIIDNSDSMSPSLSTAKKVSHQILSQLNSSDKLTIITFNNKSTDGLTERMFSQATKNKAASIINNMTSWGGTVAPLEELEKIRGNGRGDCGVFFITDGEFGESLPNPGCVTTTILIGGHSNQELEKLGQVIELDPSSKTEVSLGFFEPEKRDKFWEEGYYSSDNITPHDKWVIDTELDGNAISYIKNDAELIAARPHPLDPVLAFLKTKGGTTGIFTTALPPEWIDSKQGKDAITQWMKQILPWGDPDEFTLKIRQRNKVLDFELVTQSKAGSIIQPKAYSAMLQVQGKSIPLSLQKSDLQGINNGRMTLEPDFENKKATLIVTNEEQKSQFIPFNMPSGEIYERSISAKESWSDGANMKLLESIASQTGGEINPRTICINCNHLDHVREIKIWQWFALLSGLFYLIILVKEKLGK